MRITGARPTRFSKPYQLPKQPWGTESDNLFLSFEAVPDKQGKKQDLSGETLADDSSLAFIRRFHGSEQPTDDEIRRYIHHQEHNIRNIAAFKALGINSGYIGWKSAGGKVRKELVMEFLKHHDPRVRRVMFGAILNKPDAITAEVFELAVKAVKDPRESWWVKDAALQVIGRGSADQIVPLVDLLLPYLKHEEDWLKNATLTALTPVAADERCYQRVLPAIGDLIRSNQRVSVTRGLAGGIRAKIKAAGPAVQKLATETLEGTFTGYAGSKTAPGGLDTTSTFEFHLEAIAASLADVPGGLDVLYEIARQRKPNEILPYKEFFLRADSSHFGPKLKKAIQPIIMEDLIPEFVGRLPVIATLEDLDVSALVKILVEPKNALVKQYAKLFDMENVELSFTDDALTAIAKKAIERKTGARGLRSILEGILLDTMFDLPSMEGVGEVVVDKDVVAGTKEPIRVFTETKKRADDAA